MLDPVNFAFVMATGIVSIILHSAWPTLSRIFLLAGSIGYLGLIFILLKQTYLLGGRLFEEMKNVQTVFKYLTFSAGSNALAVRFCMEGCDRIGFMLGLLGVITTIALTYTLFCLLFYHRISTIQEVSPYWLLLAIACNSSGIVISTLWGHHVLSNGLFLLAAFSFWSFGVGIYLIFITLNIYRMLFYAFEGEDLHPAYWTCMGAAAIAVVDGSLLILTAHPPLFLEAVKPFIEGMVLLLWAWGSAWIPILCLMLVWKYTYFKIPFHYHPSLWAIVFPLGMYTDATAILAASVHLDSVQEMVPFFLWISVGVWLIVGISKTMFALKQLWS